MELKILINFSRNTLILHFEICILHFYHRGVEQLAARQAHNLEVVGSNPTPAT